MQYSDYIVYVDESGDHGLITVDPQYPIFTLACCIFKKSEYAREISPALIEFKFRWWGHNLAVLHERDIRKQLPPFVFLKTLDKREAFMAELNDLMTQTSMEVIAAVIDKRYLRQNIKGELPTNPYEIALTFCVERIYGFLKARHQLDRQTHIVVEQRGKDEDIELELAFRRICDGRNSWGHIDCLDIQFASKADNMAGLQLADLIARPIGINVLRPDQPNRAYGIIEKKLRSSPDGSIQGWGLKVFP